MLLSLAWKVRPADPTPSSHYAWDIATFADAGETLLHGFHLTARAALYHMPLTDVLAALLWNHGPAFLHNFWGPISQAAVMLLVFALGCLLGRLECGVLAASFYLAMGMNIGQGGAHYVEIVYSLLLLTTAGVMVWDAERPTVVKNLLLGLVLGTTILFRSAVFLLPVMLAAREWMCSSGRGSRLRLKLALCVGLVPFLLLVPWVLLNWIVSRKLILFEPGQADINIITGAMGLVRSVEEDWRMLPCPLPDLQGASVLRWAAQEVIGHPLNYGRAFLQRLWVVAGYAPVLFSAAGAALICFRRRAAFQRLGLLVGCFVATHCLLPVQYRYFTPLWPLLAVLAACLASPLLARVTPPWPDAVRRVSQAAVFAAVALALTLCAITVNAVGVLAARTRSHSAFSRKTLEHVLRTTPRDPWLLSRRGRMRMLKGDSRGAMADFSEALAQRPLDDERILDHAAALAIHGRLSPLLRYRFHPDLRKDIALRARLLMAVSCLRQKCPAQGSAYLRQAVQEYDALYIPQENAVSALEKINQKQLWSGRDKFGVLVISQFSEGWVPDVAALTESLLALSPDHANLDLMRVATEALLGKNKVVEALALTGRFVRATAGRGSAIMAQARLLRAQVLLNLKDYVGAERDFRQAADLDPHDVGTRNARKEFLNAWMNFLMGQEDFIAAVRLDPKSACFDHALVKNREGLDPVYFDLCIGRFPGNPLLYMERGIARYLSGRRDIALADFHKAIELKPDYLEAHLSLASALVAQGRSAEALATADRAVALAKDRKDPVYKQIAALQSSLRKAGREANSGEKRKE